MIKLLLAITLAALAVVGVAVSGWATGAGRSVAPPVVPASAPPDTVTLSRAGRVDGVALRLDVALLRRAGRTATLDLRLRSNAPNGGAEFHVQDAFGLNADGDLTGVYLVDPATGRKLAPITDRAGECLCTKNGYDVYVRPGGTTMLSATLPAPSPGTSTADVVVPHFGAFRDVPLRER